MILYQYDDHAYHLTILVRGNLDEIAVPEVRFCCNRHKHKKIVTIDCKAVAYLDSSFVPYIIKLRNDALENKFNIIFSNMNDTILHEFRLLNLHKLFSPIYNEQQLTVSWKLY